MVLDLDEIQKEISKAQEIENTINKLSDSGTPVILHWHSMSEKFEHELTREQEANVRKMLLDYWIARFSEVEKKLQKLITDK